MAEGVGVNRLRSNTNRTGGQQVSDHNVIPFQSANQVTNAEFLAAIFPDLSADEYLWITRFVVSPGVARGEWAGGAVRPDSVQDTPDLNSYFCVSSLKGDSKRAKDTFSRLFCLVLDDAKGCDLAPTWRLETSPGNYQIGYRLKEPEADLGVASRVHHALFTSDHLGNDKSGNNPVRYVRLPVGSNTKRDPVFRSRLVEWRPEAAYTVDELMEALGLEDDPFLGVEHASNEALETMIRTGESFHDPLRTLAYRRVADGKSAEDVVEELKALMECARTGEQRWVDRYAEIPRLVRSAVEVVGKRKKDPVTTALASLGSQDGIALAIARERNGEFLFAHKWGHWQHWTGARWKQEDTRLVFDVARDFIRRVNREGKPGMASSAFCAGVETFLRASREFARTGEEFDLDNYLLNTPDGTVDLRTGARRPHDPADMITLCTAVTPRTDGGDRFLRFLQEVTGGDEDLIRFLQVAYGACLSGAVESHWMLFLTGGGRNGKNTFVDLVADALGDYAKKIPASTLMARKHEDHPTEIASLRGVRLAVASEVNEGDHWHEARINELTGDAKISARVMRGDYFTFTRTHKHIVLGNHRPRLRSVTPALRERLKIVPFNQCFIGREDPLLPSKLRAEMPFVLGWLIEGHAEWIRLGRKLPPCAAVTRESEAYFSEQSTVDMWIEERLDVLPFETLPARQCPKASDLYKDYHQWKKERGEGAISMTDWAVSMRRFEKVRANGIRYIGVRLAEIDDFEDIL